MSKFVSLVAAGLAVIASFLIQPDDCDGANIWSATSFGIGGGGLWLDEGGVPPFRDAEALARAAISVSPHISVVGGGAYGVDGTYARGSAGVRLTATDVEDPNFSIGIGISRHWTAEKEHGLDEAAAEAAIGWKPFPGRKFILAALAAYGFDTNRRMLSASVIFPLKEVVR